MFAVIRYNDGFYETQNVKNLKNCIENSASAKYRGKWYKVTVLYTHDTLDMVNKIRDQLDGRQLKIHLCNIGFENETKKRFESNLKATPNSKERSCYTSNDHNLDETFEDSTQDENFELDTSNYLNFNESNLNLNETFKDSTQDMNFEVDTCIDLNLNEGNLNLNEPFEDSTQDENFELDTSNDINLNEGNLNLNEIFEDSTQDNNFEIDTGNDLNLNEGNLNPNQTFEDSTQNENSELNTSNDLHLNEDNLNINETFKDSTQQKNFEVDTSNDLNLNEGNLNLNETFQDTTQDENFEVDTSGEDSEMSCDNRTFSQLTKPNLHKRHCCFYCKKKIFQIVRHWSQVHKEEDEVRTIVALHISNPSRKENIDRLRKKGDYHFNVSNPSDAIVTRISKKEGTTFIPCPSCLGYFSKKNLRHHKKNCSPNNGSRQLQGNSRKLTQHIHEKASDTLKNIVTPNMFHDEVMNQILFDDVLVTYGNYLCIKYTEHHLINHIRAQLRLLGRFMIQVKVHDSSIQDCKMLIHSRHIDAVRKAMDDIGEMDISSNIYKHPTNVRTLLTELKKIVLVVKSESDKTEDDVLMKRAKAFSRRVKQELAPYINRICKNSENKLKRLKHQKCNNLPENEEIGKYLEYLYKNMSSSQKELEAKFSSTAWTKLTQYTMVYLAVFNRKRPGETQRIEVIDFDNRESVNEKDLLHLNESERIQAHKYERIGFRGKLGNSTALLVDKIKILPKIKLILKYRNDAGVHHSNRFLFAKPSKVEKYITFNAYMCHRKYCTIVGINHENLTFTKLRKHFATEVAKKGTCLEEERRVSTYMSHDFNIHKKIYDHSAALADITQVSKHLEHTTENRHKANNMNINCKSQVKKKSLKSTNDDNYELTDEDYSPPTNESDSEDESPSLEEVERCLGKFRKRKLWSSLEKQTTRDYFKEEIFNNEVVVTEKIRRFKGKYKDVMSHRSTMMIKQWIEREKLKIVEQKQNHKEQRPRYSTPERELLQTSMEHHSFDGSEPSIEELEELILKHEILKRRTADSLLRKFKHMQKRMSR